MKLMTKELEKTIPALYTQDGKGADAIVYVKYFSLTGWYFYATEYDPADRIFFGYVTGFEHEWGNFSLDELESMGHMIERDLYFEPKTLRECLSERGLHYKY